MAQCSDLSDEEWEALHRLNRGQPEEGLVAPLMQDLLIKFGLAVRQRATVVISPAGKRMILAHKNDS